MKVSGKPQEEITSILQWAERHHLVEEDRFPGRERFRFCHDVIADVLYRSLEMRSRKRLHLLVGGALEESFASHLRDVYEALTIHYRESEQVEKAVEYAMLAAERFFTLRANEAARAYFMTALEMAGTLEGADERRMRCLKRLMRVALMADNRAEATRLGTLARDLARERQARDDETEIDAILAEPTTPPAA